MRVKISILLFFAAIGFTGADIILHHADNMVTDLSGGTTRINLSGNIILLHEGRELRSVTAFWDQNSGRVQFIGNVVLTDTLQRIYTDTLHYRRDDRFALGIGNVRFERLDSSVIVTGGRGTYEGIIEKLTMTESPHLTSVDTVDSSVVELDARLFVYEVPVERGMAVGSVFVEIQENDSTRPPVFISADSLIFYPNRDEIFGFGSVSVRQEETVVHADSIAYYRGAERIEMRGDPELTQGSNRLTSWGFTLELADGRLSRMLAHSSPDGDRRPMGFWRPEEDTLDELPESQFTAKTMFFEFEEDKLRIAHLIREATAAYYPWSEDSTKRENNLTSGDSIVVWFDENRMDSIEVHRGGSGRYMIEEFSGDSTSKIVSKDSIVYSGEYLALSGERQTVAIQGSGALRYDEMGLDAGSIIYDFETDILVAEPTEQDDSLVGEPILFDGTEIMAGRKITYNVKTGRGRMVQVSTQVDLGFFNSGIVHKAAGDTLFVAKSEFIPCECDTARTHFWSNRIKLIPNDKAVAKNIVLYIGRLPIIGVPFFIFPIKSGRRSGILPFDIGQFQKGERFVRNIGYYWAASEYWDGQASFDFNEGSGLVLRGKTQYALRYRLKGNLSASYELERQTTFLETTGSDRWSISGSHIQNLWPKATLSGSASFVSDIDYLTDIEYDPQTSMQRTLTSNLAFSQNTDWGSFSANVERSENLVSGVVTTYLPKVRVSRYSRPIFKPESELDRKFYHNLALSTSGLAVHYRRTDSTGLEQHTGFQSDIGLSMPFSIGPYASLTPGMNGHLTLIDEGTDSSSWPSRITYSANLNATTNIYGRFPTGGFLGMDAFKHNIVPSVSFSWSPDFDDAAEFYSFGGIYPGNTGEQQLLSYSLRHDFAIETSPDSNSQGRKISLATVSTSGNYDLLAESMAFSNLSTNIRTSPFKWLSLTAGLTHSLYSEGSDKVDDFRLISRDLTTELSYSGNIAYGDSANEVKRNYRISLSHYLADNVSGGTTHWIKGKVSVYPTRNWSLDYSNYFDLETGEMVSEEFRIWRDLGCWEGSIVWVPEGYRKGWYFRVNIKRIPDIKVESSRGRAR